jgi:tape measure domain-containing protein
MAGEGDTERLIVLLEARIRDFEKNIQKASGTAEQGYGRIRKASRSATQQMEEDMVRSTNRINQLLASTSTKIGSYGKTFAGGVMGGAGAALGTLGAAMSIREIGRLADTWTELKSRIDLAAGSMSNGEAVMGRLSEMARRTYSGLEQTAESWLSNETALRELGMTTGEQLDLVETLNNALVISAAKGDRAASVMNAWSKAMALGKLSGDNLNTVISSGGRLAQALADSMGVTVGSLRKLGQEGKITTKEMAGVTSQLKKLREEADSMQATIGDAMQLLRDAMLQYVGGADQASQASAKLAETIIMMADNFTDIADVALQLATVLAGALTGKALVGMLGTLPKVAGSVAGLVTAMRAGTLTATAFAASLGPIGLAVGAISAALYVYANHQSDAEFKAEKLSKAIELNAKALETGRDASGKYTEALRDQIAMQVEAARAAYDMADAAFTSAARTAAAFATMTGLRFAPLDFNMNVKDKEAADALLLLDKLERQLKRIDEAGTTKPSKTPPPGDAGKGTKERSDDYERLAQRIADSTAAMVAETEVRRQLNPLIDDYGFAVAKARSEQDLLNAAQEAGKEITPQLRDEIAALADQYATATVEAAKLGKSQDEIRRRAEEMMDFQKDLTSGIVTGFMEGKKAADIFADALKKIADRLLNDVLDAIFQVKNTGGGGGLFGFLGNLLGGGGLGGGGGGSWAAANAGFSSGTANTGGQRGEPRGIVHGQEAVIPLPNGGKVPVQMMGGGGGNQPAPYVDNRVYNFTGTSEEFQQFKEFVVQRDAEFDQRAVGAVKGYYGAGNNI